MSYAVKTATAAELLKLRDTSSVIFTARVNQTTPLTDTNQLTYDGGTGTYTDIKLGMLVWIGSAAGLRDRGVTTVRASTTATEIYTNQIKFTFADNDYITVKSIGKQASKLGLAIQHPTTVYTARINQTFTTLDGVTQLTYDGGSGVLADVAVGMTVFIGDSAGAQDKGICRIRKIPTADTLYINQVSDIVFDDDDYITIIDAFSLWHRATVANGDTIRMDYDVDYSAAAVGGCLPRIGPMAAVLFLSGGTVTFTPPDPTLSACYDGATIASYHYEAPDAATTTDMDTSTPSWTYDTAGEYRWSCAITDSLGRITTSYRWVFVNPATIPFRFEECSGDYSDGGWTFSVTVYDSVTKALVYDRAMCTLYSTDYYSGTQASIGKLTNYENIICSGWIDGESITVDSESGAVTFRVSNAAGWLNKLMAFPFDVQDTTTTSTGWKYLEDMTVDKALFQLLFWTTTAPLVMDCFLTGDTNVVKVFAAPSGSLFDQINGISANSIFATPLVNNYNQLYIEIDSQMQDSTGRAAVTQVMEITEADRADEIDIEHNTLSKTAMIEFGALESYDGTTDVKIYSRAPGNLGKTFGSIDAFDNYITVDQDEANRIAGCLLALNNNPYEALEITLAQNNRLFDIAPLMFGKMSILAADNPRGIVFTDQLLIPRKVEYLYNEDAGYLETNVTFEFVTSGIVNGIFYAPLTSSEDGETDYSIDTGNLDFPSADLGSFFPDIPSGPPDVPCSNSPNAFTVGWSPRELVGDGGPLQAKAYFPCKLRGTPKTTSKVVINMTLGGDAAANYTVTAFKAGATVASGSAVSGQPNTWEFALGSDTDIDGFQIDLASGIGTDFIYTPLDIVSTGSVAATDDGGTDVAVVDGNFYCIEAYGGPWRYQNVPPEDAFTFFNFWRGSGGNPLGGIGKAGTSNYTLGVPTGCAFTEAVNNYYGRTYFYGDGTEVFNFCVSDFLFTDNTGSLSYVLRNASVSGRKMELSTATIQNVCSL